MGLWKLEALPVGLQIPCCIYPEIEEKATIWSSEEVFGGGCFMSWLGRRKAGLYKGI